MVVTPAIKPVVTLTQKNKFNYLVTKTITVNGQTKLLGEAIIFDSKGDGLDNTDKINISKGNFSLQDFQQFFSKHPLKIIKDTTPNSNDNEEFYNVQTDKSGNIKPGKILKLGALSLTFTSKEEAVIADMAARYDNKERPDCFGLTFPHNPKDKTAKYDPKKVVARQSIKPADIKEIIGIIMQKTGLKKEYVLQWLQSEEISRWVFDDIGMPAVGAGHRIFDKQLSAKYLEYEMDPTYTGLKNEQIANCFVADIVSAKQDLLSSSGGNKKVLNDLTQGQQFATLDLLFNVGECVLNSKFMQALKKGDIVGAIKEFDFILIEGKVAPGLCVRRIQALVHLVEGTSNEVKKAALEQIKNLAMRGQQNGKNEDLAYAANVASKQIKSSMA